MIIPFSGSTKCRNEQKFNRSSEEPLSDAKMENIDLSYSFLKINDRDKFQNEYLGMF